MLYSALLLFLDFGFILDLLSEVPFIVVPNTSRGSKDSLTLSHFSSAKETSSSTIQLKLWFSCTGEPVQKEFDRSFKKLMEE